MSTKRHRGTRRERGSVLVTALVAGVILAGVVGTFMSVTATHHIATQRDLQASRSFYMAEGASEQMRLDLVTDYRTSPLTLNNWLGEVRNGARFGDETTYSEGKDAVWVKAASPAGAGRGWVDVEARGVRGAHLDQDQVEDVSERRVVQRVSFGQGDIFNLAFLTEETNCMFCHVRVRGDVGTLDFFRPGWGVEGSSGIGSGDDSRIRGNLYAARGISGDATNLLSDPKEVNGAEVSGEVFTNYSGPELPQDTDGDGRPNFPVIDTEIARRNSYGTLTGGELMVGVPPGQKISNPASRETPGTIQGTYEGNLVIRGTESNPIVISGNVFVAGDLLIEGVVKGRGAIYAGRNTYVTGDLRYLDPPRVPSGSEDPDAVAVENIQNNKDELRLAARDNIILGDWANKSSSGSTLPIKDRQAEDYFRAQFGLKSYGRFDKETGEELIPRDGRYYDSLGREVPPERIARVDRYDGAIKTSFFKEDGTLDYWMTDAEYRAILGTQQIRDDSWRGAFSGDWTAVVSALRANGYTDLQISALRSGWNDSTSTYIDGDFSGPSYNFTLRKVIDGLSTRPEQIEIVDAFLYSNKRIAGKTSGTNIAINGGMIASQIGVLGPGLRKEWWMRAGRFDYLNTKGGQTNPLNGERYGTLCITYDFRLRNGGFGFDLISGEIGRRLLWRPN
jgi:hypothetical protein